MFCREMFGKKPKTLEFGLQPHRIPDSETVRNHFLVHFMKKRKIWSDMSHMLYITVFCRHCT